MGIFAQFDYKLEQNSLIKSEQAPLALDHLCKISWTSTVTARQGGSQNQGSAGHSHPLHPPTPSAYATDKHPLITTAVTAPTVRHMLRLVRR